ncbi:MAG: hypothetical protein JO156_06905 [Solirubrobacterales bacterium]|nr:hypothetical protein [Solirubrobacterales bacterium]
MTPPVRFFIPPGEWPVDVPSSAREYWPWTLREGLEYASGRYVTTVRTCLELQAVGFPCELTNTVTPDALIVTHVDFLPHTPGEAPWNRRARFESWLRDSFIVCYQADRPRYPYADLRLVQNRADAVGTGVPGWLRRLRPPLTYMPYWTQPGLLPRNPDRGEEFVNVAFFGNPGESDPSLVDPAWVARMGRMGFRFQINQVARWHDYRDVDAVLAVRGFDYQGEWFWKPPTKLFNAWLAGVPAVLGRESAYRAERESELDYIEVRSRAEVEAALMALREKPELRAAIVAQGQQRAQRVNAEAITACWRQFLEHQAYPAYERWRRSSTFARRAWRLRDGARTRAETIAQTLRVASHGSRESLRHRKDWN